MSSSSKLDPSAWVKLAEKKKFVKYPINNYNIFTITSLFVSNSYNQVIKNEKNVSQIIDNEEQLSLLFGIAYATISIHDVFVNVKRYENLLYALQYVCFEHEKFLDDEEAHTQKIMSFIHEDQELIDVFNEFSRLAKEAKGLVTSSKKSKVCSSLGKISNTNFSSTLTLEEDIEAGITGFLKENPKYKSFVGDKVDIQQHMSIQEFLLKSLKLEDTSTSSGTLDHVTKLPKRAGDQSSISVDPVVIILLDIVKSLTSRDYAEFYEETSVRKDINDTLSTTCRDVEKFAYCFQTIRENAIIRLKELQKHIYMCYKEYMALKEKIKNHGTDEESKLVEQKMNVFFTKRKELFDELRVDLEFCKEYLSKKWKKEFQTLIFGTNSKRLEESFLGSSMTVDAYSEIYSDVDSDE